LPPSPIGLCAKEKLVTKSNTKATASFFIIFEVFFDKFI